MLISTEIASAARKIGEEKAVEYIAKAGFDAWDLSMFLMYKYDWGKKSRVTTGHPFEGKECISFARKLRRIGEDNGIHCNQSHAPFPSEAEGITSYLKAAIECTAEAGGKICVIHPHAFLSPEENAEKYNELLPFAKACGVKIATENMWAWDKEKGHSSFAACATPESFNAHLDAVNDEYFTACLDIGHAEMLGSETTAPEMIRALGDRLLALHVHDNDKLRDCHQLPFTMKIDFEAVMKALKDINYKGYLTLEADTYLNNRTTDEDVFEGIKVMAETARRLTAMY